MCSSDLIVNCALLIVVFFAVRKCIGIGTIINMVCVGYIADFICWLVESKMMLTLNLPTRIVLLIMGTVLASIGVALSMEAELGIAPYDSVAFIINKYTKNKVSFRLGRVMSDLTVMVIGVIFCLIAKNNVWQIIGLGTIVNALVNGPLIQFCRGMIQKYLGSTTLKEESVAELNQCVSHQSI